MSNEQRDRIVLEKIVQYCNETKEIIAQAGNTREGFLNDRTCRYATAMCLMQIGELSNRLSDAAKCEMSVISWNMVRGMRNVLAHDYVSVDWDMIWATAAKDLPVLQMVCENHLRD